MANKLIRKTTTVTEEFTEPDPADHEYEVDESEDEADDEDEESEEDSDEDSEPSKTTSKRRGR